MPENQRSSDPIGVLFVCLGNICRSPAAEGVFLQLLNEHGLAHRFEVDSCGIGSWHVGKPPHRGSLAEAERRGIELVSTCRQLDAPRDFDRFEWLIAMDHNNAMDLLDAGAPEERVRLLRSFHPEHSRNSFDDVPAVPDPYGEGEEAFRDMFEIVIESTGALLDNLIGRHGLR